MYRPPSDPGAPPARRRSDSSTRPAPHRWAWEDPSRRDLLVTYALLAAVPLSLWAVAHPTAGALAVATVAGLVTVGRRAAAVARCLATCRQLTFDLAGDIRVTVTRGGPCEPS